MKTKSMNKTSKNKSKKRFPRAQTQPFPTHKKSENRNGKPCDLKFKKIENPTFGVSESSPGLWRFRKLPRPLAVRRAPRPHDATATTTPAARSQQHAPPTSCRLECGPCGVAGVWAPVQEEQHEPRQEVSVQLAHFEKEVLVQLTP